MRPDRTVTLIRQGNRMVVEPTTPFIRDLLEPQLTYVAVRLLFGWEKSLSLKNGGTGVETTTYKCFTYDYQDRLGTSYGFSRRIADLLRFKGYNVVNQDLTERPEDRCFQPDWDRLFNPILGINLRPLQDTVLVKLATSITRKQPCRLDAATGVGKGFLIAAVCVLFPRLKIHVVTKRVPVLERLYYELSQYLPDVGMCHGGMRNKQMGNRVKLYSFDSLHHSRGDADLLIIDECHEAATDDAAEQLAAYDKSINIGFSATHNMRLDNKDIRVEAMCGTIAMRITYQMAVRYGLVVPIEVVWSDVTMDVDPIAGVTDTVTRKRLGLWRNSTRNEIIAADARDESADGTQVLVVCETIEHLLFLKKRLPDFEVIYAAEGIKQEDISHFRNLGIWPESLPMMTAERRSKITKDFEDGRLRKVICNTVWNVGVNFRELGVVIRADAGDSPTGDTQIPGRAARINDQTGKTIGRIRDYRDLWNRGFNQRSGNRSRRYAYHGWRQFDNTGRLLVDDNQNGFSGFRSKSQRSRNPLNLNLATSKKPPVRKPQTQTKEST